MTAPTPTALPTVADFLADATDRLETVALLLSAPRWEDIDPVAAVRELHRAVAALNAALRTHASPDRDTAS